MSNRSRATKLDIIILLAICAVAFWWRLGKLGLIDPDEPFYAQTAREMVRTGDWVTPKIFGLPQFEKPIFFYWLEADAFKLLGENEFAARAPATLFATLLVLALYWFGSRVLGRRAGFLAALILATGGQYILMARLVLTDVPFGLFVSGALVCFWFATEDDARRNKWVVLSFVCSALAVLTKGPLGSLLPMLGAAATLLFTKRRHPFRGAGLWGGLAAYAIIAGPWYAAMFWKFGWEYFNAFVIHENIVRFFRAEHPKFNRIYFYLALLLVGSIPWSPLIPLVIGRARAEARRHAVHVFLWCWLLTSFVFLTLAASKLPSYGFVLYPPLVLLMGSTLDAVLQNGFRDGTERVLALLVGALQTVAIVGLLVHESFALAAMAVGGFLTLAVVLGLRRLSWSWIATSAAGIFAFVIVAMTSANARIEEMTSIKPVALEAARMRRDGAPIVCSRILARGIFFYTQQPLIVLANQPQPFFTPHPLPVIVGAEGLKEFVQQHGTALCVLRAGERGMLEAALSSTQRDHLHSLGNRIIVRVSAEMVAR